MLAALIMGRWAESTSGCRFQRDPLQVPVKREIKVQSCLLAIRDDIQSGGNLVMNRGDDRIVLQLSQIIFTKTIQILRSKFQPSGKRIAANNRRAQWDRLHDD